MAYTGIKPKINPEIIQKLSPGAEKLWFAAHDDGASNRIDAEAIADAAILDASLGIITAVFQGLKKAFRNRGKTKADLAAEAEAARINRTCDALRQMLLEYLQAAGEIEAEALDELIGTLAEMDGYHSAGKLIVRDLAAHREIGRSVAAIVAALTGDDALAPEAEGFDMIRARLARQREFMRRTV